MIHNMPTLLKSVVAAGLVFTTGSAFGQATLDDFAGDLFILTAPKDNGGGFDFSVSEVVDGDLDIASVTEPFGNEREFTASIGGTQAGTSTLSILGTGGVLAFDSGINAGIGDATFEVLYDDWTTPIDITDGGNFDAFSIGILRSDGSTQFSVTLNDGTDTGTGFVSTGPTTTPLTLLIDLNDAAFSGVDLTSIESITFGGVNQSIASDVAIDRVGFTVIPEPTSLVLLGMGGGLLLVRRRR